MPEKAVSSVRTAPCRQEKASGPTVKSVLVETGEAEQLSRSFTRGCRGKKNPGEFTESAMLCPVCRQNLGSPRSDCAFNLNNDHRIRHTVSYIYKRKAHRAKREKGKKAPAHKCSKGETLHLLPRNSGSLIQPCRLFFFFFFAWDAPSLRLERRTRSASTPDLSRTVPDVTCSFTNFWTLHHSFKIAGAQKRKFVLRAVTAAGLMRLYLRYAINHHFYEMK